ncbi:hypothetical protein [Blastococcus deserti]|uniref:Uncharacterized protein n=1 Tax=Blastococcus deserti TaxID=2259033 RepID=A0ABW4XEL0_9ACTN
MRPRLLTTGAAVAATLLCAAAVGLSAWVGARVPHADSSTLGGVYGVACAATGTLLAHLRPRNGIGWLLVLTGLLQGVSVGTNAYGSFGTRFAEPAWPFAPVVAQAGAMTWLPSLLLPATVLIAVYPSGRLPARWWRWPVGAVSAGLLVLTVGSSLTQGAYDDIGAGPAPVALSETWWTTAGGVAAAAAVVAGAVTIWIATVVRLVRADRPSVSSWPGWSAWSCRSWSWSSPSRPRSGPPSRSP